VATNNSCNYADPVAIAEGGTGQATKAPAFDALSPLTTVGDVIIHDGANNVRLANSTTGKVLTANSGAIPSWEDTASILTTAAPGSDLTATGVKITLVANENQAFGDVVYIDGDGEAHLADASVIATGRVVGMCADATIGAAASGTYLIQGISRQDSWNWSAPGVPIYLSLTGTTTNTLTETAPSATDECVVVVGIATHADRMLFSPSFSIVEVV